MLRDIDGRPLDRAAFIAGRRTAAGVDEALRPEDLVEGATRLTGEVPAAVAARSMPRDFSVGTLRKTSDPETGEVLRRILYAKSLPPDRAHRVIAHEVGHAIDDIAGGIPAGGLNTELRRMYSTLATGQERTRGLTGPQHIGYRPDEVRRELLAEAVRAYITDPNYIKTVAPKTAARIRAAVNADPRLNKTIQFNSAAPVTPPPFFQPGQDE